MRRAAVIARRRSSAPSGTWKPDPPSSSIYTGHLTGTVAWSSAVGNAGSIVGLFHPTAQKVARSGNTLFAVYLSRDANQNHTDTSYIVKKSTNGGASWTTLRDSAASGDPQTGVAPALEVDQNGNLYVIANYYTNSLRMYKYSAASGFDPAAVQSFTLSTPNTSGKWGVYLDQSRSLIWIVLWADSTNPNLYAFDYNGVKQFQKQIFKVFTRKWAQNPTTGAGIDGATDKHGEPAYPAVFVDGNGYIYVAWTAMACEGGDFTNAQLSYYGVYMMYSTDGGNTWLGPTNGISGAVSPRTIPIAGDDSGSSLAEQAFPIHKLSDQGPSGMEFIPASNASYGFQTGQKYNFSRLFNIMFNKGALNFFYESETSNSKAIQHHSMARWRLATGDILDSERRTPELKNDVSSDGDRAGATGGQGGGAFVQDTTFAGRLYFVQVTPINAAGTIRVLRSDDGGISWYLYATSPAITVGANGLLLVQAYRWTDTDGSITGIAQLADSPYTVYTFKVTPS